MKAIVQDNYGPPCDVLCIREIDKPQIADDEVLVQVRATSVHADIWHVVSGRPYLLRLMGSGVLRPKNPVPGTDLAGQVESVGKDVTRFKAGDRVFGESTREMQWKNGGTFAEYTAVPEETLVLIPDNIDFIQAATLPTSGIIALLNLRGGGQIQPGHSVLINGAGGSVGTIALQIAKATGAQVTGVDTEEKLSLISALGADRVIDYKKQDFTRGDQHYDLILDIASNLNLSDCKRVLKPDGTYVIIGHDHYGKVGNKVFGSLPHFFRLVLRSLFDKQLPNLSLSIPGKQESMTALRDLLESGKLTPVIDRTYSLSEISEAMRYLQEGRAQGKIIISL